MLKSFLFISCLVAAQPQECKEVTTVENFNITDYASAKWHIHQQAETIYLPNKDRNYCVSAEYTDPDSLRPVDSAAPIRTLEEEVTGGPGFVGAGEGRGYQCMDEPGEVEGCPCHSAWPNHGAYVKCVKTAVLHDPDIDEIERGKIISRAAKSSCASRMIEAIAEEAYVYSFPMMMGYRFAYATFLNSNLPTYVGDLNEIYGKAVTLDYTFKDIITPNADTAYSSAALDLRTEPLILNVPEVVDDRYYVMQFVDLYGFNAHYVGSRTTGSQAGSYLLVGPKFSGELPPGFKDQVLHFKTDLVYLLGRTELNLNGKEDVDDVQSIMDNYHIELLSAYLGTDAPPAPPSVDWPVWDKDAYKDERFIGYVNLLLKFAQPSNPSEVAMFKRFAVAGIGPGTPFDSEQLDSNTQQAILNGIACANKRMEKRTQNPDNKLNGWLVSKAFGDRDFFDRDYLLRAVGAFVGWGGLDADEALYPMVREDKDGNELWSNKQYRLQLDELPPAMEFWSVTMYDTSFDETAGYLVKNEIDRYLINENLLDKLVLGDDGSIIIYIQNTKPDTIEGSTNWLPSPEGNSKFYMAMRIYGPKKEALNGDWVPPPVVKFELM